jgi:hypothetical protein
LTRRIHQLEEALAALQATISHEPHPLLHQQHTQHYQAEHIPQASAKAQPQHQADDAEDKLIDALGTLTISSGGQKYFGNYLSCLFCSLTSFSDLMD